MSATTFRAVGARGSVMSILAGVGLGTALAIMLALGLTTMAPAAGCGQSLFVAQHAMPRGR